MPKFEKYDNESQAEAYERIEANKAEAGIPTSDGATRNVTEYAGGGKTGYNAIGNPMYKKGGPVMKIPGEQVKWAQEKKEAKPKADKPKKDKFFSKEKRTDRKAKRQARRDKKQGVVKKVETKGGVYPVYKKESKKAESFRSKFARKRKAGAKTFNWKGRSYTTETAEDVVKKKAKTKSDKSLGMKPKKPAIKTPKSKDFKKTKKFSPALGPVNKPTSKPKPSAIQKRKPVKDMTVGDFKKIHSTMKPKEAKATAKDKPKPKPKSKKRRKIDFFGFRDARDAREARKQN